MNGDIRPPRRPVNLGHTGPTNNSQNDFSQPQPDIQPSLPVNQSSRSLPPVDSQPADQSPAPSRQPNATKKPLWRRMILALVGFVMLVAAVTAGWYLLSLRPVQTGTADKIELSIQSGMTPSQIADLLVDKGLIRNKLSFDIYTRLNGLQGRLQAGNYRIAPTEDLASIANILQKGNDAQFSITFYPGATIYDPTDTADEKRTDVYTMLTRAGYSDSEVSAALDKQYDHPLFADKPKGASLEGYVYGETYTFGANTTAEQVLIHTFDHYYEQIKQKDIVNKAKSLDMSLYEAITLASIIEREVSGLVEDQKQVSQIFHRRLNENMPLGADATFMYVAMQRNVPPKIDIDSEYNTRVVAGLPPGPISTPDITALEAAVSPAPGDYLYFVSGDDGKTHFSRTLSEHEEKTAKYCTTLCQAP